MQSSFQLAFRMAERHSLKFNIPIRCAGRNEYLLMCKAEVSPITPTDDVLLVLTSALRRVESVWILVGEFRIFVIYR